MKSFKRFVGACTCALVFSFILTGCTRPPQVTVSAETAGAALEAARSKLGAPYVYGGQGPDDFDCSGLIIVFLADDTGNITHGGLAIAVTDDTIHFLNASSYYGGVIEDDWPLSGEKRGQSVAGYGRLLICLP